MPSRITLPPSVVSVSPSGIALETFGGFALADRERDLVLDAEVAERALDRAGPGDPRHVHGQVDGVDDFLGAARAVAIGERPVDDGDAADRQLVEAGDHLGRGFWNRGLGCDQVLDAVGGVCRRRPVPVAHAALVDLVEDARLDDGQRVDLDIAADEREEAQPEGNGIDRESLALAGEPAQPDAAGRERRGGKHADVDRPVDPDLAAGRLLEPGDELRPHRLGGDEHRQGEQRADDEHDDDGDADQDFPHEAPPAGRKSESPIIAGHCSRVVATPRAGAVVPAERGMNAAPSRDPEMRA